MKQKRRIIGNYVWISITSLIVGAVVTAITYFGVIVFLLSSRSLHTSGAFPRHIYDIPPIVGIWAIAGSFKLGAFLAQKNSADSKKKSAALQNLIILLLAVLASVVVYGITSVTGQHG